MESDKRDKIFKKKLGSFSEDPHSRVWNRIEKSLNAKRRKRVIPIWISLGGAAAVLILGLLLNPPFEASSEIKITDSDTSLPETEVQMEQNSFENSIKIPDSKISSDPEVATFPKSRSKNSDTSAKSRNNLSSNISNNLPPGESKNPQNFLSINESATASRADAEDNPKHKNSSENSSIATSEASDITSAAEDIIPESTSLEKTGKWTVGPSIAPIYYGNSGNGSPISPAFVGNSKSGLVNMSYGLSITYSLNNRLSFRSGINKVDLGYQTNDIAFSSNFVSRSSSLIRTINYSENSKNIVVHSTAPGTSTAEINSSVPDLLAPGTEREGQMVQQFGYIEVPMELQYSLIKNKWSFNLIGGMSSLFLVNNSISLNSFGSSLDIGEASNMNSLMFSTNIGLGGSYPLRKDLIFTLQPMFKWHLNAFSETSGQFKPYTMGVYSGLNFKF
jgi:hypothetical protein